MIDIVQLKNTDYLNFFIRQINGKTYLYCENTKTDEVVLVQEIEW